MGREWFSQVDIVPEVLMHLRNLKKTRAEVSLYDPIGFDKEGNEISLLDVLFADNDILETVDAKMQEEKLFKRWALSAGVSGR